MDAGDMASKSELRRSVRQGRRQEQPRIADQRSRSLTSFLPLLQTYSDGGVAGFQPINSEPDISPLLRDLNRRSPVYLPRISAEELEWVAAEPEVLVAGQTGIPHPPGNTVATGSAIATQLGITLLLVPALAIDPVTGTRLGYGAGWYDRLLADIPQERRPFVVGVCRHVDLIPVPAESHDEPVDAVLTEAGLQRINLR